jgi:pimeloyl-ACP methyl ester carboxylesterase
MKEQVRERDGQQWIYDWMLKTTGRAVHFEMDGKNIPGQVKSLKMAAKYLSKEGERSEKLAMASLGVGDIISARILFRQASEHFREAQHFALPALSTKRWELYARCRQCANRLYSLMDYQIELVEIPFEGTTIPGVLHLQSEGKPAPTVVFIPGMDNTKENYPNPLDNELHLRGMNVLAIDGPGQGESLERGIYVNASNHVKAATAAFDFLTNRGDIDPKRIGLVGRSFGTFWAMRAAADEPRYAAVAGAVACYFWDRLTIFDEAPIRFKQVFMAMAGMESEKEFDLMCQDFTLKGHAERIKCPVLMAAGEFDPLNPLEDAEAVFNALSGPKEFWIFEDEFHPIRSPKALGGNTTFHFLAEWMRRALSGQLASNLSRKAYIRQNGDGLFD